MIAMVERIPPRESSCQIPEPVTGDPGLVQVDATWGSIQPMPAAKGVRTVGELEVMAHLEKGLPLVDGRTRDYYVVSTIPSAQSIPHLDVVERMNELDRKQPTILFCNGPQCGQSPMAIRALVEAGYPTDKILYYRGGLHDWLTLGLPVVAGE